MLSFLSPYELNEILEKESRPVLTACLKENSTSHTQRDVLEHISQIYGEKLKICLLEADFLELMEEKFDIHGTPAFVFCFQGKKREVLLGHIETEDMRAFIKRNLEMSGN